MITSVVTDDHSGSIDRASGLCPCTLGSIPAASSCILYILSVLACFHHFFFRAAMLQRCMRAGWCCCLLLWWCANWHRPCPASMEAAHPKDIKTLKNTNRRRAPDIRPNISVMSGVLRVRRPMLQHFPREYAGRWWW